MSELLDTPERLLLEARFGIADAPHGELASQLRASVEVISKRERDPQSSRNPFVGELAYIARSARLNEIRSEQPQTCRAQGEHERTLQVYLAIFLVSSAVSLPPLPDFQS